MKKLGLLILGIFSFLNILQVHARPLTREDLPKAALLILKTKAVLHLRGTGFLEAPIGSVKLYSDGTLSVYPYMVTKDTDEIVIDGIPLTQLLKKSDEQVLRMPISRDYPLTDSVTKESDFFLTIPLLFEAFEKGRIFYLPSRWKTIPGFPYRTVVVGVNPQGYWHTVIEHDLPIYDPASLRIGDRLFSELIDEKRCQHQLQGQRPNE